MRGRKMNGSVQKAIEEITNRTPNFPEEPFQIISENPDLAIPYLNAAIDRAVSEGEDLDENYQLHFYAIFLLGQFQERESFPRIMKLVSLPRDVLDGMIGDAVTSGLQDILYNTYNGDKELLTEVSTSVYEISNITAEKPLKIRCFQLFIIFDNVVPLYYLYF